MRLRDRMTGQNDRPQYLWQSSHPGSAPSRRMRGRFSPAIQRRKLLSCRRQSECLPRLHWSRRCSSGKALPSLWLLALQAVRQGLTRKTTFISPSNARSGSGHLRRRTPLGKDGEKPKAGDTPSAMALSPVTIKGREATAQRILFVLGAGHPETWPYASGSIWASRSTGHDS